MLSPDFEAVRLEGGGVRMRGRLDLLQRLTDLLGELDFISKFRPFDLKTTPSLTCIANQLSAELMRIGISLNGNKNKPGHVDNLEIAGLLQLSGILEEPEAVTLHDACGGVGKVTHSASFLRGEARRTTARCWELNAARRPAFDSLAVQFGFDHSARSTFHAVDIAHAYLGSSPKSSEPSYCIAKHACGGLADIVLQRSASSSDFAVVMTCCHGNLSGAPMTDFNGKVVLGGEDWAELTKMADWVTAPSADKRIIGRRAMNLLDILRLSRLPKELDARVAEVLPESISVKNQAIYFKRQVALA